MKIVMNLFVLIVITFSLAACEKANNPVTPVSIDKSANAYTGTFDVTFKDYRNSSRTVSVSGNITFDFNTDTYSYNAVVVSTDDKEMATTLHDNGTYTLKGNEIKMFDNATKMMNPAWQPSLYLSGTYSYRRGDASIIIEGSGDYGNVRIVLNNQ